MKESFALLIKKNAEDLLTLYGSYEQAEQVVLWMLNSITKKSHLELFLTTQDISQEQKNTLCQWINDHVNKNVPLAYLIGSVPFLDCTILVETPILIPRPETEEWVSHLIKKLKMLPEKRISILDLCTGSGALACALAKALPEAQIVATDISEHALSMAKKNVHYNKVNVTVVHSDLFSALKGFRFDLIVSNPPYISANVWQTLDPMVKDWEDYNALVAPDNGYGFIETICDEAPRYLNSRKQFIENQIPQLFVEIGYDQGKKVFSYMQKNFFNAILLQDSHNKDRVVCGILG